jgi:E3 ubiquitin-protein ligase HERC3
MCHCFCCKGKLGIGSNVTTSDTVTPGNSKTVNFGPDSVVTAVSVGEFVVCAIVDDTLKCWGSGFSGELGQGNTYDLGGSSATIPANIKPIK